MREATAAYRATFLDVNEAVAHRKVDHPALGRHAGSSARIFLSETAKFYIDQNITLKGVPALTLQVKSTALYASPPNVVLHACVDARPQQRLDRQTGRPASGFVVKPRPQTVLVQQRQGRWTVDSIKPDPKKTC